MTVPQVGVRGVGVGEIGRDPLEMVTSRQRGDTRVRFDDRGVWWKDTAKLWTLSRNQGGGRGVRQIREKTCPKEERRVPVGVEPSPWDGGRTGGGGQEGDPT